MFKKIKQWMAIRRMLKLEGSKCYHFCLFCKYWPLCVQSAFLYGYWK